MPFVSQSQRSYLWANNLEIAKKWSEEYPNQGHLPEHKKDKAVKTSVDSQIQAQYKHIFRNKG